MFEISADHIASLNDTDLRILVGRLCEAELRKKGLPTSAATWGGNQNANDGGVDVRVALPMDARISGFVPKPQVGYQVKSEDMPRKKILREMRPKGNVRPSIQELADESGAYIIVSSQSSTTETALRARRMAMQEAVAGIRNSGGLFLDFYDANRIATWVRDHFAIILWVRQRVGRAIPGWHSHGAWAHPAGTINEEYFIDQGARIDTGRREDDGGLTVQQGIDRIRDILREPRTVVRLVGMAGVGKTRFVQALFEEQVGNLALDPSLAIYTNIAHSPDPHPTHLAYDLIRAGLRHILVIDNCTPALHRELSEICRSSESQLSVITIEYDIREDEPEGTEVFKLEAASLDLVEHIVKLQFPKTSNVDARRIAEFSSGNARIAISLAGRLGKSDTIAGLSDDELFKRLFEQRHQPDPSLFIHAQACSLVYSFQAEPSSGPAAELTRLGAMVNASSENIFASIAELSRRDLVQQRGHWRAVLPHAIANRLAAYALQNIPTAKIEQELVENAPDRLLKSLSRRLGYLHDRVEAVAMARKWLKPNGLLGDVLALNEEQKTAFTNIAPAAPDDALAALERALNSLDSESPEVLEPFVSLLHSLAYSSQLFDRAATIICSIARVQQKQKNKVAEVFTSLFFLYLSGTQASLEQRLRVLEPLLCSDEPQQRSLAVKAIGSALETNHFTPVSRFEFGARSRDYGYWPGTREEVRNWYAVVLKIIEPYVQTIEPISKELLKTLAEQFRGLWNAGMHEELTHVCNVIVQQQHWPEGWLAVRETLQFDYKGQGAEAATMLTGLDRLLQPRNLTQQVRSVVLSDSAIIDVDTSVPHSIADAPTAYERGESIAYELGKEAAKDEGSLKQLLPKLVIARDMERLWQFGQGLAESSEDPESC
jgi:hypothetical protein